MGKVHACVRALSLGVNGLELPDVLEWGASNPQGTEESAVDRLDALARYNVLSRLLQSVRKAGPDAKVTKLFGKELLRTPGIEELVRKRARDDIEKRRGKQAGPLGGSLPDGEEADAFFEEFFSCTREAGQSGKGKEEAEAEAEAEAEEVDVATLPDDEEEEGDSLGALIWSPDFESEMQKRRERRSLVAEERTHRIRKSEDAAQTLRDMALAAQQEGEAKGPM